MDRRGRVPASPRLNARPAAAAAVLFLAQGFGTGRSPRAPGTVGTLPGLVLFVPLASLSLPLYIGVVLMLTVAGVWLCDEASRLLREEDPPSVVWDEIVGVLIALTAAPLSVWSAAAGFALFRLFDIWKPGPIGWADRRVGGGIGIMLDDVLAGLLAALVLNASVLAWSAATASPLP